MLRKISSSFRKKRGGGNVSSVGGTPLPSKSPITIPPPSPILREGESGVDANEDDDDAKRDSSSSAAANNTTVARVMREAVSTDAFMLGLEKRLVAVDKAFAKAFKELSTYNRSANVEIPAKLARSQLAFWLFIVALLLCDVFFFQGEVKDFGTLVVLVVAGLQSVRSARLVIRQGRRTGASMMRYHPINIKDVVNDFSSVSFMWNHDGEAGSSSPSAAAIPAAASSTIGEQQRGESRSMKESSGESGGTNKGTNNDEDDATTAIHHLQKEEHSRLSSSQSKALHSLKDRIAREYPTNAEWISKQSDITYLRFLRGHDFNVNTAFKFLVDTDRWRREFGTDELVG